LNPAPWEYLVEDPDQYWTAAGVVAVIVGALAYFATDTYTAFADAIMTVAVASVPYTYMRRAMAKRKAAAVRIRAGFDAKWNRDQARARDDYLQTRSLMSLMRAPRPTVAARQLIAKFGTVYLGLIAGSQAIVAAPWNKSVLVLGSGQRGKTTGIAMPAMMTHPGAMIAGSTKPDVFSTARARAQLGRVWFYDPIYSVNDANLARRAPGVHFERAYWSPLWGIRSWQDAILTAKAMVATSAYGNTSSSDHDYWKITAEDLVAPLLLAAAAHPACTMETVVEWMGNRALDEPMGILLYIANDDTHPMSYGASIALRELRFRDTDPDMRHSSSVWSTAKTVLQAYRFEEPLVLQL
jgi:type IV secretory pathway TraG/TraD family ATPase VirD4